MLNAYICGALLLKHLWEKHHQLISKGTDIMEIIGPEFQKTPGQSLITPIFLKTRSTLNCFRARSEFNNMPSQRAKTDVHEVVHVCGRIGGRLVEWGGKRCQARCCWTGCSLPAQLTKPPENELGKRRKFSVDLLRYWWWRD